MADTRAQVIVVGLGAMGAAVLYQLAQRGIAALGIDRHPAPHAFGSSHGETRITRCAVGEGQHYTPLAVASHRIWRELEARTGKSLLVACGCLVLARPDGRAMHHGKADFLGRTIESARAADIPHEVLDDAEIAYRYPQLLRTEEARGCFEPGGGFVRPERCIGAQLECARALGAEIRWDAVTRISQTGERPSVVVDGEVVEADQVVVAAGPWTGQLLGRPFDRLFSVYRQVLHWFPADEAIYGSERFPALIWMHGARAEDYFYSFPALAGTGEIKAATEQYQTPTAPDAVERTVLSREQTAMFEGHLAGRLDHVRSPATRSAVCLYTVTPDSRFIIDRHPRMDRVTVISACSGHGFKHSAAIGDEVAEWIQGDRRSPRLEPFSLS